MFDWLIVWLVDWLIGWLVDLLIGWLVDWLICWLVDWLVNVIVEMVPQCWAHYSFWQNHSFNIRTWHTCSCQVCANVLTFESLFDKRSWLNTCLHVCFDAKTFGFSFSSFLVTPGFCSYFWWPENILWNKSFLVISLTSTSLHGFQTCVLGAQCD